MKFKYRRPTSDKREESCHVYEETIEVEGKLKASERGAFLERRLSSCGLELTEAGKSLGLLRPKNTRFFVRPKAPNTIEAEREAYREAGRQQSLLDQDLTTFEPTPYEFRFKFDDAAGSHDYQNADWEAHAMFYNGRKRLGSDKEVIDWMMGVFNDEYPSKGMLFAIGNVASRPHTWQLLGVLRTDTPAQGSLL